MFIRNVQGYAIYLGLVERSHNFHYYRIANVYGGCDCLVLIQGNCLTYAVDSGSIQHLFYRKRMHGQTTTGAWN